jgi:hypothetical protein
VAALGKGAIMSKRLRAMRRRKSARERKPVEPQRRLPDLDRWEGLWVAVKDGEVIAAGNSSNELVRTLVGMGPAGRGAVAQYVPRRSDTIVVGVG